MRAALDDFAAVDHENLIGPANRGQAVRDHEAGTPLHQRQHSLLDVHFGAGVDGAGRLIENQHGRVGQNRAGDGQKLSLPLRQVRAGFGQLGVIALRQALDKLLAVGQLRRAVNLLVGRVRTAIGDVGSNRSGEQIHVLKHHAQAQPQRAALDVPDVDSVDENIAGIDVVKPHQQIDDGGLARAGGADERDRLTGLCFE